MEAECGDLSRAAFALERAESEGCCLHERIWTMHSDVLVHGLGAAEEEERLIRRAVRNLPWSSDLWCRRLRGLERLAGEDKGGGGGGWWRRCMERLHKIWLKALELLVPSPDNYLKVRVGVGTRFRVRL
ncbi:unnamed protein product, partial [Discosporangium mesarthrocarpum]